MGRCDIAQQVYRPIYILLNNAAIIEEMVRVERNCAEFCNNDVATR